MSSTLLSCDNEAQLGDGLVFQMGNDVFVAIAVAPIDALAVHDGEFVMYLVVKQVAEDHQSHVATVVHTMQGVGTLASEEENGLGIDIHQLEHGRRQGILHRIGVFELSEAHGEGVVVGDAEIGVEFLYDTGEVVHEEERPAVGDARLSPEECALQVEVARSLAVGIAVGIAALSIAVKGDATGNLLHPVDDFVCLLL